MKVSFYHEKLSIQWEKKKVKSSASFSGFSSPIAIPVHLSQMQTSSSANAVTMIMLQHMYAQFMLRLHRLYL